MGEMLSQAEIEALLNGEALPDPNAPGAAVAAPSAFDAGELPAQAPGGDSAAAPADMRPAASNGSSEMEAERAFIEGEDPSHDFTIEEIDALGEIGNISMGNSATTLFTLLGRKVNITTPTVSVSTMKQIADSYSAPLVVVKVEYTEGLLGSNMLILRESDVMVITDLMMGGDGTGIQGEITDLHLSAISEAMNQMIGNASTSMSNVFDMKIDISPPNALSVKINDGKTLLQIINIDAEEKVAVVSFEMIVEDLLDTMIMQIQPYSFAKKMIDQLMEANRLKHSGEAPAAHNARAQAHGPQAQAASQAQHAQAPAQQHAQQAPQYAQPYPPQNGFPSAPPYDAAYPPQNGQPYPQQSGYAQPMYAQAPPQQPYGQAAPPQYAQAPQYGVQPPPQYGPPPNQFVNVQPANFQAFEEEPFVVDRKNIGLVMDVNLEVSVELGRTHKLIREILEFGQGTIIELDKLAGEPVDILVNGKIIAKGEVVVIDESFGVRVTDIIHPSKRI